MARPGRSSQVMGGGIKPGMGVWIETPRCRRMSRSPAVAANLLGPELSEDMDSLTLRNIDPDGNEVLETGQQGTPVPVRKLAPGVAPRARPRTEPALPSVHRIRQALSGARRNRRGAVEIWPTSMVVPQGSPHLVDVSRATASSSPTCTITPTIIRAPTRSIRAATRSRIFCCRDSCEVKPAMNASLRRWCSLPPRALARAGGVRVGGATGTEQACPPTPSRSLRSRGRPSRQRAEALRKCVDWSLDDRPNHTRRELARPLQRKNVLAGLMFMSVALLGLFCRAIIRGHDPADGTGYVPFSAKTTSESGTKQEPSARASPSSD